MAALDAFLRQRETDAAVGAGDDDPGHQFRSSGKVGSGWNSMPSSTSFLASSVRRLAVDAARLGFLVVDLARLLGETVADIVGVLGHLRRSSRIAWMSACCCGSGAATRRIFSDFSTGLLSFSAG